MKHEKYETLKITQRKTIIKTVNKANQPGRDVKGPLKSKIGTRLI